MDENAPVLVTGGTGTLGSAVVAELQSRSRPVRILSRRARPANPAIFAGDLSTGEGVQDAVLGTRAVIHCATSPTKWRAVDLDGTRRLLRLLGGVAPESHLVYISIVGCDRNSFPYYRIKAAAEDVLRDAVAAGRNRASIVRATQFHQLVRLASKVPPKGPVALSFKGMRFQPCDTAFVARRLVDVALSEPRESTIELAGPEVVSLRDAIRLTAEHEHRSVPRVVELPAVGGALRSFVRGINLPGASAELGGTTYAQWLAGRD
ncbi:SDR family oxidoreductase [Segeticoccus rhizosphaerae]|jgi:uncharacterized protein YbjT (DUF2867 family)|uniref:SDR family oxidoreductase n=1 Tax=Segeticoccus rhizosphaerae TaxID=1104777 RepID=UPI0010BFA152|nr:MULTISPECIES: NAD-dependent epimerase/dehydratase family protein [Intrasporangiaceae]